MLAFLGEEIYKACILRRRNALKSLLRFLNSLVETVNSEATVYANRLSGYV